MTTREFEKARRFDRRQRWQAEHLAQGKSGEHKARAKRARLIARALALVVE